MYGYQKPSRFQGMGVAIGVVAVVAVVVGLIGLGIHSRTNHHDVTLTVSSKERVENSGGNGSKYLVFAEDKTYQVTDNIFSGDFSSSDRYAGLEEGHTYTCDAVGYRVPFLSWYENLLDCTEATP